MVGVDRGVPRLRVTDILVMELARIKKIRQYDPSMEVLSQSANQMVSNHVISDNASLQSTANLPENVGPGYLQ